MESIENEHGGTIVAALAYYALGVSDPSACYAALRATNPNADWDAWVEKCELRRKQIRELQNGALNVDVM